MAVAVVVFGGGRRQRQRWGWIPSHAGELAGGGFGGRRPGRLTGLGASRPSRCVARTAAARGWPLRWHVVSAGRSERMLAGGCICTSNIQMRWQGLYIQQRALGIFGHSEAQVMQGCWTQNTLNGVGNEIVPKDMRHLVYQLLLAAYSHAENGSSSTQPSRNFLRAI